MDHERHLDALYAAGISAGLPDDELLRRFLERRERADRASRAAEAAFEAIVRRHGPMVLGVCRRYLADPNDAEDAFQAIFLILFRRAAAIRIGESLGPWLHGVSRRVAARARTVALRRKSREAAGVEPATDPAAEGRRRDASEALDEELGRLPARYRVPIILCHLEGLTYQEAARRLGCPVGTVGVRLSRGRELLKARLSRRDATLAAGLWMAGADPAAACTPPPSLVEATLRAATATRGGPGPATAASASIASLSEGFLRAMFMDRVKAVALGSLSVGLLIAGGGLLLRQASAGQGVGPGIAPPGVSARGPETGGDERTRRSRELIYFFRDYRVFSRDEEWARTIRELAAIGKDAVPELVAELDRADRDATLRSLGFTLRAIGDPRAVPALIRAIPRTLRQPGSDCGVGIIDRELRAFMREHQDYRNDRTNYVSCGRPVNEILTALKRITGHDEFSDSAGNDVRHIFLGDAPDEQAGQRASFDQCRQRWESWWSAHWREFATPEELQSVERPGRDEDLVEAAGVARYGPLFPTGKGVRLGPVRMLRLATSEYANAKSHLDLDTGRTFAVHEGMKAADWVDPLEFVEQVGAWHRRNGIDVRCQGLRIDGTDLQLWRIDDGRWDTIEAEVRKEGPLALGPEANDTMVPFAVPATPRELATYLFTTREGGRGILQAFARDPDADRFRLRYRMWMASMAEPADRTVGGPARAAPARAPFGPVIVTTLEPQGEGRECFLGIRSGRKAGPPGFLRPDAMVNHDSLARDRRFIRFYRDQDLDLLCYDLLGGRGRPLPMPEADGATATSSQPGSELVGFEMTVARILPQSFEELTVAEAADVLDRVPPSRDRIGWMTAAGDLAERPDTFAFRTRGGMVGLLQRQPAPEAPGRLAIRYRLEPVAGPRAR
ncbi:ECF RNA polymerase sigma factor SigE [Aquisphaera giovannonii]|uniref:ECF RNA polymerase sigma factor SigE n=1 Tax=Aquisphaera giovannonii TaxID=406548 RepID=A0A5B9VUF4_9BACT|nr:RNA polymerase sigma factor [Aquisphaera giovannonii]QEH32126.1 ECF RNA polymerase sigma factor SigE [Aquisphaera giovannonii]